MGNTGPPPQVSALAGKKEGPTKQGELSGILKELGYTADQVGSMRPPRCVAHAMAALGLQVLMDA